MSWDPGLALKYQSLVITKVKLCTVGIVCRAAHGNHNRDEATRALKVTTLLLETGKE